MAATAHANLRNLLFADVMSDVGTFMQTVGAAWLMVFALPAGAIGDIVDRRRLILYTEFWMVGVATVLAVVTIGTGQPCPFAANWRVFTPWHSQVNPI